MKTKLAIVLSLLLTNLAWADPSISRGEYVVSIAGCNDCHTDGYTETGGQVPKEDWLLGSDLGYTGPWGTSYATNLRLSVPEKTEDEWVKYARNLQVLPPMPWFSLHHMTDEDLRSIYRFIRSLGADGEAAPKALPPDQTPEGPHVVFPAE
ncbi:MAG: hypothetical protein WB783_05575 [Arenicellales bacterium]